ncbi:MAG: hypothetical protein EZS28_017243 [Streblomastix strix]|uniref:DNA-directed DNA polymerase n=1 Tax=Streblomastix strix TaxID=222440 RepID=A0A5J4VY46_9EUKA|nr:MAG: hypothetical protein EZS28_017243 [Streblomastix strix]
MDSSYGSDSGHKLNENVLAVEFEKQKINCNACIQVTFAISNCSRNCAIFHYVYGDTDSMMLAVAGDPNQDYTQGFSAIVSDKQFYHENFYKFFPDPSKDVYDEKKLLGVVYEHCGSSLIAFAPKNYLLLEELDMKNPKPVKLKKLNLKSNPQINQQAYEENIKNGTVVKGKNISLRQCTGEMSQIEVHKKGIIRCRTKMVALPNYCCCPFIYQLAAESYNCQELQ